MADTLAGLQALAEFDGRAAVMGFCYGGPYAILGPKRLGYAAGISCHGTRLQDYIGDLAGVTTPVCLIWGDDDNQAPPVLDDVAPCRRARAMSNWVFFPASSTPMMPDAGPPPARRRGEPRWARARHPDYICGGGGRCARRLVADPSCPAWSGASGPATNFSSEPGPSLATARRKRGHAGLVRFCIGRFKSAPSMTGPAMTEKH
jgi:hypothetical protein